MYTASSTTTRFSVVITYFSSTGFGQTCKQSLFWCLLHGRFSFDYFDIAFEMHITGAESLNLFCTQYYIYHIYDYWFYIIHIAQ